MEDEGQKEKAKGSYLLPASILIAGVLIAGSVIFSTGKQSLESGALTASVLEQAGELGAVVKVSDDDHIRGAKRPKVTIVEFSDLECPFCKRFHGTMKEVLRNYPQDVAWIYRHLPLPQLHSKAPLEAEASECAWDQGGNDAFWKYVDKVFEVSPTNNGLDLALLPQIAEDIGLNRAEFESCLESGKFTEKVSSHVEQAGRAGGRGTPYSVLIVEKTGKQYAIPGAFPFTDPTGKPNMKDLIEAALSN